MKKEDLEKLGLTEEQIAEIQKLNGLDIKRDAHDGKDKETERYAFRQQLETTQEA